MKKVNEHNTHNEFKIDLTEYARIVWRKKYMLIVPIVISLGIVMVGVRFLKPVYRSGAVIRVEDRQFLSSEVAQFVQSRQGGRRSQDRETLAKIEATIMANDYQDELIRRLALDRIPRIVNEAQAAQLNYPNMTMEDLIFRRLRALLTKKSGVKLEGPGMFELYFRDNIAEASYVIAEAMANLFVEIEEKAQMKGVREAGEFSEEQLALYKAGLDRAEKELEDYKRSMTENQLRNNPVGLNNIRQAETDLSQIEIEITAKKDLAGKMKDNIRSATGSFPNVDAVWSDPRIRELQSTLIALLETEQLLALEGSGGEHPDYVQNEDELDATYGSMQRYLSRFVQTTYTEMPADYQPLLVEYLYHELLLNGLSETRVKLSRAINRYRTDLAKKPEEEREVARLQENVRTARNLYQTLERAKAATQLTEAVQSTDLGYSIEVVQRPEKPLAPVEPNVPKIFLLAIVFGGVIGVFSLFLSEYIDTSFRKVDDIESELDAKVLGTIPHLGPGKTGLETGAKKRVLAWAAISVVVIVVSLTWFYFYGKSKEKEALKVVSIESTRR